jgi:hypothetical protein
MSQQLESYEGVTNVRYEYDQQFFTPQQNGVYYFGFLVNSAADQGNFYLDDFTVSVAPDQDVALVGIQTPPDPCAFNAATPVTFTVANQGLEALSSVQLSVTSRSATGTEQTASVAVGALAAGEQRNIDINLDLSVTETYSLFGRVSAPADELAANDTLSLEVKVRERLADDGYTQGFEGQASIQSWRAFDVDGDGQSWAVSTPAFAFEGQAAAVCLPSTSGTSNDWFISSCFFFEEDKSYLLSMWTRAFIKDAPVEMEVWLGDEQNPGGMTEQLRTIGPNDNEEYVRRQVQITPQRSGLYYIGFRNVSEPDENAALFLDEVKLAERDLTATAPPTLPAISVYPNPNNGKFTLQWPAPLGTNITIIARTVTGKAIYTKEFTLNNGQQQLELQLPDVPSGLWLLQLNTEQGSRTIRLVGEK